MSLYSPCGIVNVLIPVMYVPEISKVLFAGRGPTAGMAITGGAGAAPGMPGRIIPTGYSSCIFGI